MLVIFWRILHNSPMMLISIIYPLMLLQHIPYIPTPSTLQLHGKLKSINLNSIHYPSPLLVFILCIFSLNSLIIHIHSLIYTLNILAPHYVITLSYTFTTKHDWSHTLMWSSFTLNFSLQSLNWPLLLPKVHFLLPQFSHSLTFPPCNLLISLQSSNIPFSMD